MSLAEWITLLFVITNGGRVLAIVPQIISAARCSQGAKAVSRLTWGYFAFAHLTASLYGFFSAHDLKLALIFLGSFAGCSLLVIVVSWKRWRHRENPAGPGSRLAPQNGTAALAS